MNKRKKIAKIMPSLVAAMASAFVAAVLIYQGESEASVRVIGLTVFLVLAVILEFIPS